MVSKIKRILFEMASSSSSSSSSSTRDKMDKFNLYASRAISILHSVYPEAIKRGWELLSTPKTQVFSSDDEQLLYSALTIDYVNDMLTRDVLYQARLDESRPNSRPEVLLAHKRDLKRHDEKLFTELKQIRVKALKN